MLNTLTYELINGWARVTLNRPEKRNAMSAEMIDELEAVLWEADEDRDVHAVLIRGAGSSFCSGYDMSAQKRSKQRLREGAASFRGFRSLDDDIWHIERNQRALMTIFDMHKPVVAQVHGSCVAGGLDLVMLCDIVIAAEDAEFSFPAARNMGTLPMNLWLWHVPVQWAKRLLLTGDTILGTDAARIGMVLQAVPADQLETECVRLMDHLGRIDADVLAANKRSLNLGMELMGARTLQRVAAELDGRGHQSRAARQFMEDIAGHGMKEANRRRDEPFDNKPVTTRKR